MSMRPPNIVPVVSRNKCYCMSPGRLASICFTFQRFAYSGDWNVLKSMASLLSHLSDSSRALFRKQNYEAAKKVIFIGALARKRPWSRTQNISILNFSHWHTARNVVLVAEGGGRFRGRENSNNLNLILKYKKRNQNKCLEIPFSDPNQPSSFKVWHLLPSRTENDTTAAKCEPFFLSFLQSVSRKRLSVEQRKRPRIELDAGSSREDGGRGKKKAQKMKAKRKC